MTTSSPSERSRAGAPGLATAVVVLVTACGTGYLTARMATPVVHNRYFPWIVGRGLGLAAYFSMALLVSAGIWLRHPWRFRWPLMRPEAALRYHAALAGATVLLVVGHLASLASDSYAGVGWIGAILPGRSVYRTVPVALGVAGFWAFLLIAGTARLGGRLVGRKWLPVHQLAVPVFATIFVHGVLAGTDSARLRWIYIASGSAVLLLWLTRHLASRSVLAPSGAGESQRLGAVRGSIGN